MGLFSLFEQIARAIDAEYNRRVKAASNITEYGVSHHAHAHHHESHTPEHPEHEAKEQPIAAHSRHPHA